MAPGDDGADGGGQEKAVPTGYPARQLAAHLLKAVLVDRQTLDEALAHTLDRKGVGQMAAPDRGLARLIAATVLRRHGQLEAIVASFLERPLPAARGNLSSILLAAAAQLVFIGTPAHAAINIAVEQCRRDRGARRFARLANAVLRRIAERGQKIAATQDVVRRNIPDWLWARWAAVYGEDTARLIAAASLREAALDITVKSEPELWAKRLSGRVLSTGSVRLEPGGRIEDLDGYAGGAWWVQDAAAALPARLLGAVAGHHVADLCAAPGGKTAQLAAGGARVTAVDFSRDRLARLRANLARLGLTAELAEADVGTWSPGVVFDAVLLDAPCIATGTLRRHPDILRLKRAEDIDQLAPVQARLLRRAAALVKPGGRLVYCTCSLEPEEGVDQVARLLAEDTALERAPITAGEIGIDPRWITPAGDLRTLPCHLPLEPAELSGIDGFFAARLRKRA